MQRLTLKERLMRPWQEGWGAEYRFLQYYLCRPFSESQRSKLDNTNKVIMPLSALHRLTSLNTAYPMMFSVHNPRDDLFYDVDGGGCRTCHCGVLDFTADEGSVHMPRWMMDNLGLIQGDLVFFQSTCLPNGTYIKLQPHTSDFVNLSDPKAVLEKTLNQYSCLTMGDTITIAHNGKQFCINIVETKPSRAIDIVDADCEVDFVAPLDYKEPEKKASKVEKTEVEEDGEKKEKDDQFIPFKGLGRRLDGAPSAVSNGDQKLKEVAGSCTESSCQNGGCKKSGKPVFGSDAKNGERPRRVSSNKAKDEGGSEKGEINKFQPFTGKKRTLM